MMKRFRTLSALVVFVAVLAAAVAPVTAQDDQTTITFWHAMSGSRADVVQEIVDTFNEANPDVNVVAEFTGSYAETLTKALAAYQAGQPPHIVQVYEVGTRTMLDSEAIVPIIEVSGGELDQSRFV